MSPYDILLKLLGKASTNLLPLPVPPLKAQKVSWVEVCQRPPMTSTASLFYIPSAWDGNEKVRKIALEMISEAC